MNLIEKCYVNYLIESLDQNKCSNKILFEAVSHSQAMNFMKKILKNMKRNVVEVIFKKSNGKIRKMKVHFDQDFVNQMVKDDNSDRVLQIKATNKAHDNMVVCELLPNGRYQFRTIPLRNVYSLKVKNKM